jgi:hypothetical protein
MTSCIVLFVGFNLFIAAFGDEPHNYKYNTDKISTAMKTETDFCMKSMETEGVY